jgi:hypothetical protein
MKSSIEILVEYLFNQKTAENNGRFYGLSSLDVERRYKAMRKTSHKWLVFHEEKRF